MNILFVTQRFFPHGDATSVIVRNIAEELCKRGNAVTVLALCIFKEDCQFCKLGEINIQNYYSSGLKTIGQIRKEMANNPIQALLELTGKVSSKIRMKTIRKYKLYSMHPNLINDYKKAIKEITTKKIYDLCIATLLPLEGVYSAINYCPQETMIGLYQLDTYWNNLLFPYKYSSKRLIYEKRLIQECSFILTTPQIYEINTRIDKTSFDQLIPVEFPMVKETTKDSIKFGINDGLIHCAFVGTLYRDIRPPRNAIQKIAKINNPNIIFDFYGFGQELITELAEYSSAKDRIKLHGSVSSEIAEEIELKSDFLVNIDNTVISQVPSKIFEYISTGKPIINFYFNSDSTILNYLKNYPLCINILMDGRADSSTEAMELYILENKGKTIPFKNIKEIYYKNTPVCVANTIIESYRNRKKENSLS